jgi:cell division protein ftsZ
MIKDIKRISNPEQDNEENESNEGAVEGVISFV